MDRDLSEPVEETFSQDILSGIYEWHLQHPDATLTQIEHELDARWYRLRLRMLADLALQRETAHWQTSETAQRPICPECGRALIRRGRQPRQLKTHGDQTLTLTRSYGYCPNCRKGLFPPR